MYQQRKYQIDGHNKLYQALRSVNKVVFQQPTGSGKTYEAIKMMLDASKHGRRVCVITERITLTDQMADACERAGIHFGVIRGDDPRYDWTADIQICTIQTIAARKRFDQGMGFDLFIVDECHIAFKALYKLMEKYPNAKWVGLTATPWAKNMGNVWEFLLNPVTTQELIKQEYLCKWRAFVPPAQIETKGIKLQAGEFNVKQLGAAKNEQLYADIVRTWESLAQDRPTLCFAINIEHSKQLSERFRSSGFSSRHIDCYTDSEDTRDSIAAFEAGRVQVLCSVSKLAVGFDSPKASALILARPTRSMMLHYQMIGRGLRIHPGKEDCLILDHAGNIERLGLPDDPPALELDTNNISDREVKRERLPKACPECGAVKASLVCPNCGHEAKPYCDVKEAAGELKELTITQSRRLDWMRMLKRYEREQGYKNGWAIFAYRDKFGVEPKHKWVRSTLEPDQEVLNWIKYRNIKRANSRSSHSYRNLSFESQAGK